MPSNNKKYSHDYYMEVTKVKRKELREKYAVEKECVVCGKKFKTSNSKVLTCSDECREIRRKQVSLNYRTSSEYKKKRNKKLKEERALFRKLKELHGLT